MYIEIVATWPSTVCERSQFAAARENVPHIIHTINSAKKAGAAINVRWYVVD